MLDFIPTNRMEATLTQNSALYLAQDKISKRRTALFRQFALRPEIRPAMLSSTHSATHTSRKGFNQDNGR
jgi:hypothetical protein